MPILFPPEVKAGMKALTAQMQEQTKALAALQKTQEALQRTFAQAMSKCRCSEYDDLALQYNAKEIEAEEFRLKNRELQSRLEKAESDAAEARHGGYILLELNYTPSPSESSLLDTKMYL